MGDSFFAYKAPEYTDGKRSINIASFEVEAESLHSFKELYKRINDWLINEDYKNIYDGRHEFFETLYWERNWGTHKEYQIWWRAWKRPLAKMGETNEDSNKYFTYFFKINYHTIRIKPAEVMHKGKKWSTNEADTVLRIKAYLVIDDEDWDKGDTLFGGFLKAIRPRFREWLYKDKIWFHREFLYRKAFELQNVIKEFLGERLNQDIPPNIYKEKGLG